MSMVDSQEACADALSVCPPSAPAGPFTRPRLRALLVRTFAIGVVLSAIGLLVLASFPLAAPRVANGLRRVIGAGSVAALEDIVYGGQDRWNRLVRRGEPPKSYWEPPVQPIHPESEEPALPAFRPEDVGPMLAKTAAPGDGLWSPVEDTEHAGEAPLLYRTLVHPDPARPWAELFVVAIDLARVRLNSVVGAEQPEAKTPEARAYRRTAVIPEDARSSLVAAFNGGWRTEHGQLGMKADGVLFVPPKDRACVVAAANDDTLRIAPWAAVASEESQWRWWRQTPGCLYVDGAPNDGLSQNAWAWGAAVSGETVIRRSAIGLAPKGDVLFMGVSNATTAPVLAAGMHHAGASNVAELDVNWSFPKFLVFHHDETGKLVAQSLFAGFVFDKDDYLRKRSEKDFFYLARRGP